MKASTEPLSKAYSSSGLTTWVTQHLPPTSKRAIQTPDLASVSSPPLMFAVATVTSWVHEEEEDDGSPRSQATRRSKSIPLPKIEEDRPLVSGEPRSAPAASSARARGRRAARRPGRWGVKHPTAAPEGGGVRFARRRSARRRQGARWEAAAPEDAVIARTRAMDGWIGEGESEARRASVARWRPFSKQRYFGGLKKV